jgi:phosphoribosylglycinamide formyltransferase-1
LVGKHCNVAVLASGTGTNLRAIAGACRDGRIAGRVACLISDVADAGAHDIARSFGIPSHTIDTRSKKAGLLPEVEEEIVALCRRHEVDLIALAGFMRILKGPLLREFDGRIMNIHPSLLPSFKGLHAVKQALEYGAKVAGCTVHFVDSSVDGGAIILQAAVPITGDDTEESLLQKVHAEEYRIYVEAIDLFARDRLRVEGRRVRIIDPATPDSR